MPGRLRRFLKWLWVDLLLVSGCLWWARRQLRRRSAVVVLMFHRVLDESDYRRTHSLAGIVVRQRTFARLAAYIVRRCEPVSLEKVAPGVASPKIRIALTFDDGWRDNYTTALPVAGAHGLPMTVFVCPSLSGCGSPFWPERVAAVLRALRPAAREPEVDVLIEHLKKFTPENRQRWIEDLSNQLGMEHAVGALFDGDCTLSWEEIGRMDRAGVTFGSHTHTHQILTALPSAAVRREIRESKAALERALGKRCDLFAYPNGEGFEDTRRILAEEGFRLAFTTERGAWTEDCDPLRVPRPNICERNLVGLTGRFSPAMFEYTAFWKTWRAMRAGQRPEIRADRRPASAAA